MKKLTLTLLIALMCAPVMASEDNADCKTMSEFGSLIMEFRQKGLPLSTLMDIEEFNGVRDIIIGVYKTKVYSSKAAKQKAINEFRDAVAMDCYSKGGE